jgi:hypothetical protein
VRGRFRARLEFGPVGEALFEGDDLLGFGERKLQRECFAVGQRAVARELPDAAADREIPLAVPANEQFRLLLVRFELGHGAPSSVMK